MLGYRTIGLTELKMLFISNNPIYGQQKWQYRSECGCNRKYPYGIVCFFKEPICFKDKNHIFEVVVNLKKPMKGLGDYEVPKNFSQTKIFTFRGRQKIELEELYVRKYEIKDIKAINLKGYFNQIYTTYIREIAEKQGIEFHNSSFYRFNLPEYK